MPAPSATVETEVTEGTRPVHIPEEEFCERVMKPQPATCQVKQKIVIEKQEVQVDAQATHNWGATSCYADIRVQGTKINFPSLQHLCREGADLSGLSVVAATTVGVYGDVDLNGGVSCTVHAGRLDVRVAFSKVQCEGSQPVSIIQSISLGSGAAGRYGWATPFSITARLHGTAENLIVADNHWYPEECVARAQRGR